MNLRAKSPHSSGIRFLSGLIAFSFLLLVVSSANAQWFMGTAEYFPVGSYPYSVITADFNGDGRLDLAVANSGADPASEVSAPGSVSILLGNGDSTFAPKVDYPTGSNSASLTAADFNGDGRLDLAVANFYSSSISILLGKGDGTFLPKNDIATHQTPAFIATEDFNRDGKPDLAVTNFMDNAFTILLGKGDGTFQDGIQYHAGVKPVGIAVADFNGDGILDVATSSMGDDTQGIKPEIHLEFGKGDGSFDTQNQKRIEVSLDPMWLIAADFNGDGRMDLAVSTADRISVLLRRGDGTFLPNRDYFLSSSTKPIAGLAAEDLNGDGNLDLAAATADPPSISFLPGDGRGGFTVRKTAVALLGKPNGVATGDFNGDGRMDVVLTNAALNNVTIIRNDTSNFIGLVPIVLSVAGANNSFYTSEMTLTNRGTIPSSVQFIYTPAFGGGTGGSNVGNQVLMPAGRQIILPDVISFLKELGVPIPDSGNRGGALWVGFATLSSPEAGIITVRTTTVTRDPIGRAGLAYSDVHTDTSALWETSYICGLRQDEKDRSNVAVLNAGSASDGNVTLLLSLYSGDPAQPSKPLQYLTTLGPGEFKQFDQILVSNGASIRQGFVKVERHSGTAPYFAYGVINDQSNSDGSFILPSPSSAQFAIHRLTLPVMVETSDFSSELVLSNLATVERSVRLDYVADAITSANHTASLHIRVRPNEQIIIPKFVQYLRDNWVEGVGPAGPAFAGAVFVTVEPDEIGDASGLFVNGRTSTPGGGGRFGLFYPAVPEGQTAQKTAWLYGLQQNGENRTNLALINTGETDNSTDVFKIELFDGATGSVVKTIEPVEAEARRWLQLNTILAQTPGTTQGYARISRVSGNNPFIAYAVINDGAAPGQRSGDGAFIAMERGE